MRQNQNLAQSVVTVLYALCDIIKVWLVFRAVGLPANLMKSETSKKKVKTFLTHLAKQVTWNSSNMGLLSSEDSDDIMDSYNNVSMQLLILQCWQACGSSSYLLKMWPGSVSQVKGCITQSLLGHKRFFAVSGGFVTTVPECPQQNKRSSSRLETLKGTKGTFLKIL